MYEANDLLIQSAWMREEMAYGHAKTHGYPEKLRRLKVPQSAGDSVLSFMSRYWDAFQAFSKKADETREQRMIQQALQQLGKVPNGLVDKVGMALWLIDPSKPTYIEAAIDAAFSKAVEGNGLPESVYFKILKQSQLPITVMGQGIESLHREAIQEDFDPHSLLEHAIDNAIHGTRTWSAYLSYLRRNGLDDTMPRPGVPSGTIEIWQTASST